MPPKGKRSENGWGGARKVGNNHIFWRRVLFHSESAPRRPTAPHGPHMYVFLYVYAWMFVICVYMCAMYTFSPHHHTHISTFNTIDVSLQYLQGVGWGVATSGRRPALRRPIRHAGVGVCRTSTVGARVGWWMFFGVQVMMILCCAVMIVFVFRLCYPSSHHLFAVLACINSVPRALCWCMVCVCFACAMHPPFCVFLNAYLHAKKLLFEKAFFRCFFFAGDGYPAAGRPHGGLRGFPQPRCDAQAAVKPWDDECMFDCMHTMQFVCACCVVFSCFCFQMVGVNGGGRPNGGLCGCINVANSCGAEFLGVLGWGSAYFLPCLSCFPVCLCLHFCLAPPQFFRLCGRYK